MKICFMQHTTFCFFFIFVLKMYLTFVKAIFYTAIVEHFYRQRSATKLSKRSSLLSISNSKYLIMEIFVTFFLLQCTAHIANISFPIWNTDQQIWPGFFSFNLSLYFLYLSVYLFHCTYNRHVRMSFIVAPVRVYVLFLQLSVCPSLLHLFRQLCAFE